MKLVTAASGRRRLLVIHNPTAGRARRRRLDATLEALELLGCTTALRPTRRAGDGEVLAREVCPDDGDLVIAAGGDGTINEVVNGLLATRPNGGALPLAILPLGTANVLANELGLDSTPDTLARAIASGPIQPIALGRAGQRYFVSMAGVGFDAHVVASVNLDLKRRIGKAAYVLESLRQLATFPFPGYRLSIDGHKRVVASAIVTRGRYYGGRYLCAPKARHSPSVVASLHFRTVGGVECGALRRHADPRPTAALAGLSNRAGPRVSRSKVPTATRSRVTAT